MMLPLDSARRAATFAGLSDDAKRHLLAKIALAATPTEISVIDAIKAQQSPQGAFVRHMLANRNRDNKTIQDLQTK